MNDKKKFVRNLFLCRFAIFICMTLVAIWFVFIPWKVNLLAMSESQLGFVFMIFGLGSLVSIQITNRILLRRYSAESLIRFSLPLFPITFFFGHHQAHMDICFSMHFLSVCVLELLIAVSYLLH